MHLVWMFLGLEWLLVLLWTGRIANALHKLPRVPDLLAQPECPVVDADCAPRLTVIVPACNEEQAIEATLRSLLAQPLPIEILAVDDRSTDATGAIMDRLAAEPGCGRLRVLHVAGLPSGWTGKTHAMAVAAQQATTDWLLFTDGDVFFREDALLRALTFAEAVQADHLVVLPTLTLHTPGERMMISLFQALAAIGGRAWRIPDPRARREFIGVGAFNLVRATAYRAIGGFESLRMEVLEDMRLGFKIKRAGFLQHLAFGRNLVSLHWAPGALGIVRNMTKNFFAFFRFRPAAALAGCFTLALFALAPFLLPIGLAVSAPHRISPGLLWGGPLLLLAMLVCIYRYYSRYTSISAWYALLFPVSASLLVYSMARSAIVTLARGGVVWRGTFYSLEELRKNAGPLW